MSKDYYKILGLSRNTTKEEISKAFKKLARKYHPDVNQGDKKAEEKFKNISEAYDVLSHPDKRRKYDRYGRIDFDGFPGGGQYQYSGNPFGGGQGGFSVNFGGDDFGDILGDIFGGAGGSSGARARQRRRPGGSRATYYEPQRGKDFQFDINLDFMEAVKGCDKKIRLSNGATYKVKIPIGVLDGQKIRLAGKGEPGLYGGSAGDLFIIPKIQVHPYFKRLGHDIELDLPITIVEALEGARVKVPTLDGLVEMKIPAGSQSGQKLRMRGKGVMNFKTKTRGNQYVTLSIKIPKKLDRRTREALKVLLKGKEDKLRKFIK